ncbi:hypothetical protein [Nannocystis radixulma]|uniref:Uncharacterized protein n=1 Tax=Nannocystis radixulma TaxID=2995305 RepID=A0ABT5BIC8_9BACT|nr:hypothetical protein [Nannocystis radixulma]MDC0673888.1 hypothetical protein [Nannocystis radixulma]
MSEESEPSEPVVHGALMAGFAQACVNLNIVAGRRANALLADIDMGRWFPLTKWMELERMVGESYANVEPIRLKLGIEMMTLWYHHGPGKMLIHRGADFLHFQTGSNGIASVIRGPRDVVGSFDLAEFDAERGHAVIRSSTPFDKTIECGVLIGGVMAPGDLHYVDVTNEGDLNRLVVEFH